MITATGPLFVKPRGRMLMLWAAAALLNLAAGVVISSAGSRLTDLESMMRWGREWLARQNVYYVPDSYVDYPPNAIVLLSPLGVLPMGLAAPAWALLNIGFACLAPYFAARFFRPHDPFRVIALPVLMFLCWGGVRTLTQFTLVALALSMAALNVAERRPSPAGVLLGLALLKPPVAIPVFLWAAFTRRWSVVLTSVAVLLSLFAAFCLWTRDTPIAVVLGYGSALAVYHTGEAILSGLSEIRPLIWQLVAHKSEVDAIAVSVSLGLLAAICVAGALEGASSKRVLYAAPALAACWVLLSFRHLTYGFVVLLPVLMLLAFNDAEPSRLRRVLFWTLQLGMMFDVPGLARRMGLGDTPLYMNVFVHADRALMLALLIGLAVLAWREAPEPG